MKIFRIFASLAFAAGLLCACDKPVEEVVPLIEGEISLASDADQLRSDGVDAVTFNVTVTDGQGKVHDVTEHAEIYLSYEKKPLAANVFTTQKEGEYVFYAVYAFYCLLPMTLQIYATAKSDFNKNKAFEDDIS